MEKVTEWCSICTEEVEIEATLNDVQVCPECGSYIVACSLCEGGVCSKCKLCKKAERLNRS